MEPIDISHKISDFKQVFEKESRMIFSAKFGDGKSYFLHEFINSYDSRKNDFYFITLHPVNYVVEDNKDIIEYIKRDILFQLIKDDRIFDYKEADDKFFDAVCNKESLAKLLNFLLGIAPVPMLGTVVKKLKELVEVVQTVREKYQEQDIVKGAEDYLNGFYGMQGSISECDAFTMLIQKTLKHQTAKSILIVEDLDRIDPAHLFRIMNVLSSQVDNPYYADSLNGNKFGFEKILLVMDYNMTKHVFQHFYGINANYEGYMNKFLESTPFEFSITVEAQKQVRKRIQGVLQTEQLSLIKGQLMAYPAEEQIVSLEKCISKLSVRQCKEFLDADLTIHVKPVWSNNRHFPTSIPFVFLLVCFKYLSSVSLEYVFDALMDDIHGMKGKASIQLMLPLYALITHRDCCFVCDERKVYDCSYDIDLNRVSVELTYDVDRSPIDIRTVRDRVKSMKEEILDLIIG